MGLAVKNPSANERDIRDAGSTPGSGRSLGGGHGNLLEYSCLENPMDRGTWWAMTHRVTKSQTWLKWLSTHSHTWLHLAHPDASLDQLINTLNSIYNLNFPFHCNLKPLTVWITKNCGKFLKRWEYQTTLPVSWETCMQVKTQQSEHYVEQLTDSKLGKEYNKSVYCHPAYLIYRQTISCEMPS